MYDEYGSIDELNDDQCKKLAELNHQMIQRVNAVWDELNEAGKAAGLDSELVLDFVTGWLQVAVDHGHRLDYRLTHPPKK